MNTYTQQRSDVREERILDHMDLVRRLARSYGRRVPRHIEVADLESAGTVGLIRAVDAWEEERGVAFEPFAIKHIRGSILDHLRAQDPLPYSTRVKIRQVENAARELERQLERFPRTAEIASHLDLSVAEVSSLMAQAASTTLYALEDLMNDKVVLADVPDSAPDQVGVQLEWRQTRTALANAIQHLPHNERLVVTLYYFERLKMKEIARVLGVSESRVSQLRARAMLQLRTRLREAVEVQE